MTVAEKAPECETDMHGLCTGPKTVRREGAPKWEAPIQTLVCGCSCHRGLKPPPVSRADEPIREG